MLSDPVFWLILSLVATVVAVIGLAVRVRILEEQMTDVVLDLDKRLAKEEAEHD